MIQDGNTLKTRGLWKHPALFLMLLLVLLLCIPAGSAFAVDKVDIPVIGTIEDLEPYEDDNWAYQLNNVNWDFPFNFRILQLGIDTDDNADEEDIYAEVRLISQFDFDIVVKKPNITADDVKQLKDVDSDVVKKKLYRRTLLDTDSLMGLIGFLPYVSSVTDMAIEKNLVAGANVPCRIKGTVDFFGVFKVGIKDLMKAILLNKDELEQLAQEEPSTYHTNFTITSVEPLDPDYDGTIYAYVGDEEKAVGGFGVIGFKIKKVGFKVGPIIDCDIHMNGWDIITAQKDVNEWNVKSMTGRSYVHSCAEEGEDGCISWTEAVGARKKFKWEVRIRVKVWKVKLVNLHHLLGKGNETTNSDLTYHHKSLTFNEEVKNSFGCDHLYYPVPVNVWADEEMRQPVSGAAVSTINEVKTDSIMQPYATGVTDEDGTTTLWLPYSNVRYAMAATSGDKKGYGVAPADMNKGNNEPVNIVLREGVPDVLSSYTVEFYYQKDGVYPDEPDRSETRTGFIGDLAFLTEEDLEPGRERYELDSVKSAIHYGVVQKDGSTVLKAYFRPWYLLTYDLNGGSLKGSTSPVVQKCNWGDKVSIEWRPERKDFLFRTWLGDKKYAPGESYTVTGDHVFTAAWESNYLNTGILRVGLIYDEEETLDHFDLRLFSSQGEIENWLTRTNVISDTETEETIYFETIDDYYYTVEADKGYIVTITNTGKYAGITDRCYTGGTITVRKKVPKTGDEAMPFLWIALIVTGMAGIGVLTAVRRRKYGK